MTKAELNIHYACVRTMRTDIKDLYNRIENEKTDDASNLKGSYDRILQELRFILIRGYDAEK